MKQQVEREEYDINELAKQKQATQENNSTEVSFSDKGLPKGQNINRNVQSGPPPTTEETLAAIYNKLVTMQTAMDEQNKLIKDLKVEVSDLRTTVQQQNERIDKQNKTIDSQKMEIEALKTEVNSLKRKAPNSYLDDAPKEPGGKKSDIEENQKPEWLNNILNGTKDQQQGQSQQLQ